MTQKVEAKNIQPGQQVQLANGKFLRVTGTRKGIRPGTISISLSSGEFSEVDKGAMLTVKTKEK